MGYNDSNFIYLKTTSMEKYYDELVRGEHICEYFPTITKIIVRKVLEGVLKNIAEKYSIESSISVWNLLDNIKFNSNILVPEEIYNYIKIVLVNGYEHASRNNKNKKNSRNPIEILETMHNILCWYLKKTEPQKMILIKELKFKAPSTIEYAQKEVDKIKEDILLKYNQINNLRQKIIELSDQSKNVSELNKIIIAIKEEGAYLEATQELLTKKMQVQKDQVSYMEKNYKTYIKRFEELQEKCNENQEFIFNKESQLVKAEVQKQELKNLDKELYEQDESIRRNEQFLEDELKTVRKAYERLTNLTTQYEDILETLEFSYDKDLQKILELQKNNIEMQINFEDRIFNENINNYSRNISETRRKIIIFKEMLNEKIKKEIKYSSFYRGFLRLEDKQLRIIYTMINNANTKFNLINKSKELLLKSSEDKFLESINTNLEELKNINDDEIKLVLYYKLMKLAQVSLGNIYNRRQFIQTLDNVVDKAYEILMIKKDFKDRIRKLDAINAYYLEKVISNLKSKNSNLQINDELADKIYENIKISKQNPENIKKENIYYGKFNLDNMSESILRTSIKLEPFTFLLIMVDIGGIVSYKEIYSIIFEVENFITKRHSVKVYDKETFNVSFSNEYFMVLLFLSSGSSSLNQKQQEELLPLLIMAIMSIDVIADNEVINLENYNRMVDIWKHKQEKYNDISIEKKDKESELELLIKEKQGLEINYEKLSKTHEVLYQNYNSYKQEFNKIVINSEKIILLPSFREYDKIRSKKEEAEEHINESKNKLGTLKSILSPEVWKDQANKIINESNIMELEKSLIKEAKEKPYFKKECQVFVDLKSKIQETTQLKNQEKENLKNKNLLIDNIKIKITELQKQLNNIKDVYIDIEEGYY